MSTVQQSLTGSKPVLKSTTIKDKASTMQEVALWYALSTLPRNENSVAGMLANYGIEVFFPTSESMRTWKNRRRVTLQAPLFVGYVFVRIRSAERSRVLGATGAIRLVGNSKGPISIPTAEIEFLRSRYCRENFELYQELVVGARVRVSRGAMEGIEGVLIKKNSGLRFVLSIPLINQHIAAVVDAADLEPIESGQPMLS